MDDSYEAVERRKWASTILDCPELLMMHAQARQDVRSPFPSPFRFHPQIQPRKEGREERRTWIWIKTNESRLSPPPAYTSQNCCVDTTMYRGRRGSRRRGSRGRWRRGVLSGGVLSGEVRGGCGYAICVWSEEFRGIGIGIGPLVGLLGGIYDGFMRMRGGYYGV
jgi:hypothetical protein